MATVRNQTDRHKMNRTTTSDKPCSPFFAKAKEKQRHPQSKRKLLHICFCPNAPKTVLYAIFFASLELDFFRYPRFILCDNMEDKGMEKERTQNFQNQIVAISQRMTEDHQTIFATSMVSDELNNNVDLCVGEYYDQDNKTLKV